MRIKKDMTCYMCGALATTTEHAPPDCFFPEGFRRNLFTVPSCVEHNHDNSTDVEYARNVICGQRGTENKAGALVFETAKRCFDKRPKLFFQTFAEVRKVTVDGEETAAFPLDLPRLRAVMRAIAHALYFRDMGVRQEGSFGVFFSGLESRASLYGGFPDRAEGLRRILRSAKYVAMPVPEPEVFKYGVYRSADDGLFYRFEFYGGFRVNAWTRPFRFSPYLYLPVGHMWIRAED